MRGDWMQTFTGGKFYPLDPRPEDVELVDIAHALAMICRYGGHVKRFYSVAEHSVLLSYAVAPEHRLWALVHDVGEAYVGDLIRPLKREMLEYRATEDLILRVICARFGIEGTCPPEVKEADFRIMQDERAELMTEPAEPWRSMEGILPLGIPIEGWSPERAKAAFILRFHELVDAAGNGHLLYRGPVPTC